MKFTIKAILLTILCINSLVESTSVSASIKANNSIKDRSRHKNPDAAKQTKSPFGVHSLFSGNDSSERMSYETRGVPPPAQKQTKSKFPDSEKLTAQKIVNDYRKKFDFLDYKLPIDDCLNQDELSLAYSEYDWPMGTSENNDPVDYARQMIAQYDKTNKGCLNFVDFCTLMEDLWSITENLQQKRCTDNYDKSVDTFQRLFDWLDRNNDKFLDEQEMVFGLSRVLYRDASTVEIHNVFNKYAKKDSGKLDYQSFILAIANGDLDDTFSNEDSVKI